MQRRNFLKMVGATGMLGACSKIEQPVKHLIPFVVPPEDVIPGVATWYSSTCRQCPSGCGTLVKIQDGQAKKIEGNPLFPVNKGKLCAMGESSLQVLYNPDRIKKPLKRTGPRGSGKFEEISWKTAQEILVAEIRNLQDPNKADRLHFFSKPLRGHLSHLVSQFMEGIGSPHHYHYTFLDPDVLKSANELCFGINALPHYDIAHANTLLSFGANFLENWLSPVAYSREYGEFRQGSARKKRGKFIQCEPRLSLTAANADVWIPIRPGSEGLLAMGMVHIILQEGWQSPRLSGQRAAAWGKIASGYDLKKVSLETDIPEETIMRLARDFTTQGPSLALCGASPMARPNGLFHAIAVNILNDVSGNVGQEGGIRFYEPFKRVEEKRLDWRQIADLPAKIAAGQIQTLLLNEANLLFHAPLHMELQKAFEKIPTIISFSSILDETGAFSDLILPIHTPLESFGDFIPEEDGGHGSIGLMQPVVSPVYDTRPLGDIFLAVARDLGGSIAASLPWDTFEAFLMESWEEHFYASSPGGGMGFSADFKPFWQKLLQNGGLWKEKAPRPIAVKAHETGRISRIVAETGLGEKGKEEPFHFHLYPSIYHYDGRGASQPWLQEAPDPMTTISWGSWIELHTTVADKLGIKEGDILKIQSEKGFIEAPAYPSPGIRPDTVAMPIGQGHTSYGRYATGRGVNPLEIAPSELEPTTQSLSWSAGRVLITKTGKHISFAKTEGNASQLDHELARSITASEAARLKKKSPLKPIEALPNRSGVGLLGLFPGRLSKYLRPELNNKKDDYRWGMSIDLDRCTGCGACNIACHAENNIPIVGETGIKNQREMNWIRVERYWKQEEAQAPRAAFLPMLCQHCANAPCEPVCPVYATYHTPDGLNAQVYNRCVGTRYCAVNCPYKVRSYNWVKPEWPEPLDRQLSPDLSVRGAGVMEKCTFCVQRIRTSKEDAKIAGRKIRDGEIQPACVQACPSSAMNFGSLLEHNSAVSRAARDPRRYRALEHLNTESAVIYLKRVIDA